MFNPQAPLAAATDWRRWLVPQDWARFTPEEHAVWDTMYARQVPYLGTHIVAFDVAERLGLTDAFLIASGASERQVNAIVDSVEEAGLPAAASGGIEPSACSSSTQPTTSRPIATKSRIATSTGKPAAVRSVIC